MPSAPDLAGSALDGRYELHDLIGEGTFGRVYRGLDRRLRRPVAIKVIKPWWSDDPDWAERFEREAQLLARVSDPGIVQIFDAGQSEEGLYYVAELVEGESLAARLRRGPLAPSAATEVARQLCRALAHTHARGVVHRDIKPANVLLTPDGRVKLGDFSIARLAEGSTDGPGTIAGTPRYMAPEQARGLPTGPATDLYSVGVVLYEMLAGRPPFEGGTPVELALRHLQDPPPPLPGHVPRGLCAVVSRALAKAPADRHADAAALATALEPFAAAPPRVPGAPSRAPAAPSGVAGAPSRTSTAQGASRAGAARGDVTRIGPSFGLRRNLNPSARRRTAALIGAVLALLAAMVAGASLIGGPARVAVPRLIGLPRAQVLGALHRAHLTAQLSTRYDAAVPAGRAISQAPAARRRLDAGSVVAVMLSAGPPPVRLPRLSGLTAATASSDLARLGLRTVSVQVPAPGRATGTVTAQSPSAGRSVPAHSSIRLWVAEAPRWRTVLAFSGTDAGRSAPFTIRGGQWRVVYSMSYIGTCTFIIFCDGPTAHVSGASTSSFDLGEGSGKTRSFDSGPGSYTIAVTPGNDTARWSFVVQDRY